MATGTSVEIIPTVHATLTTTALRIDDDFKITVRQESPDKDNPSTIVTENIQRNYSGLQEGNQISGSRVHDPVEYVRVTKLDDDARVVIGVKCYHPENESEKVPAPGIYWYNTSKYYNFYGPVDPDKSEGRAPDPEYPGSATQSFSLTTDVSTIFNNSSQGALPTTNTVAVSWTADTTRLYEKLGTLEARRNHIKLNILDYLNNPDWYLWLAGSLSDPAVTSQAFFITTRLQTLVFWLEMNARAISIDSNLDSERKFNLLNGETTLLPENLIPRMTSFVDGNTIGSSNYFGIDRSGWTYRRYGSVGATSPYNYDGPTATPTSTNPPRSEYRATLDSLITLTGADVGDSWTEYVRKLD